MEQAPNHGEKPQVLTANKDDGETLIQGIGLWLWGPRSDTANTALAADSITMGRTVRPFPTPRTLRLMGIPEGFPAAMAAFRSRKYLGRCSIQIGRPPNVKYAYETIAEPVVKNFKFQMFPKTADMPEVPKEGTSRSSSKGPRPR